MMLIAAQNVKLKVRAAPYDRDLNLKLVKRMHEFGGGRISVLRPIHHPSGIDDQAGRQEERRKP